MIPLAIPINFRWVRKCWRLAIRLVWTGHLTTGVISGLQRPIRARNNRPIEGAIQTDASINPGNSGGPLLDSHGRMIGINSQILSPVGSFRGCRVCGAGEYRKTDRAAVDSKWNGEPADHGHQHTRR